MLLRQITTPAFMLPSPAVAEKSSIFEKIQPFIGETLDFITREEEKKGVYLTKEDLVDWEKRLNKDGKFEYAFEIFEWMDKKKMEFSPSELAVYVDLIAQTKGIYAAEEYFNQVEPVFDRTNTRAKNWPAFASIVVRILEYNKKNGRAGSLHHLSKREMRIVVAPFSSSAESQITTSSSSSCSAENAKSCIFGKLQFLITETLDFITREEEKKGVSVPTKEDLVFWAKQLDKDGKNHYALEIFEWMDKKKMEFSPSELAFFVDLIAKTKSLDTAKEYFNQVEPNFDRTNTRAKNWPAFATIMLRM
ncbi:unnamed protein product [Brassica oleracea var. botrytis]